MSFETEKRRLAAELKRWPRPSLWLLGAAWGARLAFMFVVGTWAADAAAASTAFEYWAASLTGVLIVQAAFRD